MTEFLLPATERAALRRAVRLEAEAVSMDRFRLLGRRVLDLSATGLLLSADQLARRNEVVLVHLFAGAEKLVAEAEVARVIPGARRTDRGPALGLRFSRVSARALRALLERLRGTPPPIPRRRLRRDYAATVRAIRVG